ncbi:arylsulfotransferase family protein [Halorussus halophilus]|uniref:arylsulfotransferase family protein n=1 Tax=Halorussus halophilus TaxID=2650975 RepID=UPI001CE48774|nr:arylsulfotransferase family protein [Halorussus halophilus]
MLGLMVPIGSAYMQSGDKWTESRMENRSVEPTNSGITVVTTDAYGGGQIAAYDSNGDTIYYNNTYEYYHDVDPSDEGKTTVFYVATKEVSKEECHSEVKCRISVAERLNLTTGEVTRLWSDTRPKRGSSAIHDIDYVGDGKILVAEIGYPDGVTLYNTTTGDIEWKWRAEQDYKLSSGGKYPGDWTHINDVELLDDGRIMISVRNQDQVAFVKPGEGVLDNQTLGEDDNHDILFEAHNPDYINESNGGPSVLVADSENNRVIEYQKKGSEWKQSWVWRDAKMQWPRDADRLPNGNTLITDTNSDRVLEVNEKGKIVWSMKFPGPYEAERLGTGDESTGGKSAAALGLSSRNFGSGTAAESAEADYSLAETLVYGFLDLLPTQALHALLYVFPAWVGPLSAIAILGMAGLLLFWLLLELRWSKYTLSFAKPVRLGTHDASSGPTASNTMDSTLSGESDDD